jgi:hypothetical protein
LPRPVQKDFCAKLDQRFHLTQNGNMEVKVSWLRVALGAGYDEVLPETEHVLKTVGRLKYLLPLYAALQARTETAHHAMRIFEMARPSYHPIAQAVVAQKLAAKPD